MNESAILSLIADMYGQIQQLTRALAERDRVIAELRTAEAPSEAGGAR